MNNIVNKRTYLQQEIFCCFFVGKATAWVHKTKFELNLANNLCKTGKRLVLQGGQNSNHCYKHKTCVQNAKTYVQNANWQLWVETSVDNSQSDIT